MERVYVVPLRKAFKKPRTKRADTSIRIIREFVARHSKVDEVKIGKELNEGIWSRGRKKIPRKVKIKVVTEEKEGKKIGKVELVGYEYKEMKVQAPKVSEETKKKIEERLGPKAIEKQREDEMIEKGEKPERENKQEGAKPEDTKESENKSEGEANNKINEDNKEVSEQKESKQTENENQ